MFVKQETHNKVLAELKASQDQRIAFLNALGLDPENTEDDAVLTAIQNTMNAKETADADLATANTAKDKAEKDLKAANTAKETAENSLKVVTTALDELGEQVQKVESPTEKVEAVRTMLAEKPGSESSKAEVKKDDIKDQDNGVDQEFIDNLPHNKEVDANQ